MKDKETMRKEIDHIPTHQETKAKCFEAFEQQRLLMANAEASYKNGFYHVAKHFLDKSQEVAEEIRKLVGGSNG